MSDRARTISAIALISACLAVVVGYLAADPTGGGDRAQALADRLRCPICDTESIADSPSQVARDLFDLIEERVAAGWTDEEIISDFVATYGEEVLLDPPNDSRTALLWALPVIALGLGVALFAGRRARAPGRRLGADELERVEAEVSKRRQR